MMVAQGGFDKKEEVENPSEVLLNPSDPEATFRYKAGGRHLGYVGNVVEAVGEKSSLVIVYDYQQNTYADNQFMKDYLKLDIENPIIRINTAFKGCSSLEKISVLPRIYHN